jgi:hypothetical protein
MLVEKAHLYEDVMNNFDVLWGAKFQQPSFSHSVYKISWIIHAPQMSLIRFCLLNFALPFLGLFDSTMYT